MSPCRRVRLRVGLVGAVLLLPLAAMFSISAVSDHAMAATAAAANNGLTIAPTSGQTLTGGLTFTVPAPGCPASGTANGTVVTLTGPGVTPTNDDNSTNINAALPATRGTAITMDTGGVSWDGIALDKSLPRPLNGTYTVKLQCMEDGEATGQAFFDREVTFTGSGAAGSPGTWTSVGGGSADPTPTPGASPTPTPGATSTPTPAVDPTPTPEPAADDCATTETCEDDAGTDDSEDGADDESGGNLPGTGGQSPTDIIVIAALLLVSGLMFLALAVEPRLLPGDESDGSL